MDSEPSNPFRMFGKKKNQDDEPKKALDLAAALPASDDFRTSLLMTGLSARFSMLREQDDPNSKLGKASDDSVLFPRRQSRMMDFGLGSGLQDIAETDSLMAPPFGRFDSYQSDDASSINGSIMARSKPNEGNNLFGGRQKVYKLTAGSKTGMSGRALYDDDVATSAFQKWRQSEKERKSLEESHSENEAQMDYSHRRETNSTTSSGPSAARNSTAATSITSQQSFNKEIPSNSHLAGLERTVTRNRRLYEQGLSQDLQDQQTSAVSRMDTLSRRPRGARTPDTPPVPSPTSTTFGTDRPADRKPILAKASAPNLRSFSSSSSTTPGPSRMSPPEPFDKFSKQEQKPAFGASPPLSPPISETEDYSGLAIQPNDRGKATAMGVFARPSQQYDESRYAQRQRQLQQGRDPSGSRMAADYAPSSEGERSRSSSSQRDVPERLMPNVYSPNPTSRNDARGGTFFDESDDASDDNPATHSRTLRAPQLTIERPDDQDHPAFRKSALPTPLSLSSPKTSDDGDTLSPGALNELPEDSPTLGPNPNTGLSGMVRQHLRNDSNASSVYGAGNQESSSGMDTSSYNSPEKTDRNIGLGSIGEASQNDGSRHTGTQSDEFARHLADGARRVRERLTTYVESDTDRSAPPTPLQTEDNGDLPVSKSSSSGLAMLKPKSSKSSLFDKGERERGRAKTLKSMTGRSGTSGTSPSPHKASTSRSISRHGEKQQAEELAPSGSSPSVADKDDNVPVGLKAFRQARRELQKMKELEMQNRHTQKPGSQDIDRPTVHRGLSHESGPPPVLFNRKPREESNHSSRSRAGSQAASERDRSGSDASSGGRAFSRGPRLRNGSATWDEQYDRNGPSPYGRQGLGVRPEGALGGPDPKRSPMMMSQQSPINSPNGIPFLPNGGTGPSNTGMSPSHSMSALDSAVNGRWNGRKRDISDSDYSPVMHSPPSSQDMPPYTRSRNGSLLGAASSTPNLHASASVAPPLPPINPRRKNGFPGRSDEGSFNGPVGMLSEDDEFVDPYRQRRHPHGQMRQSPPRGMPRPPLPHSNISSASLPGGMI